VGEGESETVKIKDIMRYPVKSLPQNATLREVVTCFVRNHVDTLPIIDAAERVVGMLTIRDLTNYFLPGYEDLLRDFAALEDKGQLAAQFENAFLWPDATQDRLILANDVMNARLRWISQNDSLLQAAAILQAQNCKRLPVIDRDQKLVGLISDFEVVLALLRGSVSPEKTAKTVIR
jgi:CBS domain-containing membrane protein